MSDAGEAIRDAMVAAMRADPVLCGAAGLGVEPGEGSLPRIEVAWPLASDFGTKTEVGRELRTFVTVRVAKGQRGRLPGMSSAVEVIGAGLSGVVGDWRVASAVFVRTRMSDAANGVRTAVVEHRVRVLS